MADFLRLFGKQPHLVSCTPKLLKYSRLLKPYSKTIAQHADALAPHLPRILDCMEVLAPYLDALFDDALPQLLPYMGALLDELPVLEPHLAAIVSHRAELLPALPYLAPRLPSLRPHVEVLASRLDALAPYVFRIAPHLDALLPHMPLITQHIDVLVPHLQVLTQEEALLALLPYAELLLRTDLQLLLDQAQKIADAGSGLSGPKGSALLQELLHKALAKHRGEPLSGALNGVDAGADVGRKPGASDPSRQADANNKGGVGFWEGMRKLLGSAGGDTKSAPPAADGKHSRELLSEVETRLDGVEARLKMVERQFVDFKETMNHRYNVGQAGALKLAAAEGHLIAVEDGILELTGATKDLHSDVEAYARTVSVEAINRGKERQLVSRKGHVAEAQTDNFLWRLPL
uniref:Uncharacterized protein n=1 Tax=Calcidiscus leptoporus TaxID=127549 RepID=A0A7S0P281_9EUKA|mmetsp:Transcript_51540/g.118401  ORF Transcript_51540/g.118401 Transcript_51540/m.118401 type:complete len:404 (+) Transcript_51540:70-1281(+)|eukprot:CAMPEP_0119375738 /NCGR_PEP_ID=MMETSP1334-20130426/36581_1 /TAXON_ID=127549 /ORGANISM="Calcidiscus leptoporus, Strain RCC1130" /LENGTH=403 /DNA_ID=CAMNT_0007394119 /DNA_START=70 /DNA_END=1281 /DNA_ORIENTATION=-